jgi:dTDP-4-dehydrorhamnose reductase
LRGSRAPAAWEPGTGHDRAVKLLVTGGAGYLGSELCRLGVERGWDVLATQFETPPPYGRAVRLDVRADDAVQRLCLRHGPNAIVHTAYLHHGPAMESTIVRGGNAVARASDRCGARLVHLSTDLVFDGEHGAPYREDSDARPVSAYGAAKLEAERLVLQANPDALVVRTSLLYGKAEPGPQERLAACDDVVFFTDEIRCPARVGELAEALLELALDDVPGVLHLAGPEAVSRYELARRLRARQGLDPDAVRGAPSPRDRRARNVALDSSRARRLVRTQLSPLPGA